MGQKRPQWLPEIVSLNEFNGDTSAYLDRLFKIFNEDFVKTQPKFEGGFVYVDTTDEGGKPKSFLHLTSGDASKTLDMRRSERICWIRPMIENCKDKELSVWENERPKKNGSRQKRICILYEKERFIVILRSKKNKNHFLITAYHMEHDNSLQKKIRERNNFYNQKTPQ
jgi:hypothetical protein